jgi:flagellar biosynthesis/type III secretory pathway chaperone
MSVTSAFVGTLRRELDGMRRLSAVLDEEFAALSRGDADALERLMGGKSAVLAELQDAAAARATALQAAGVGASRQVVEIWLKTAGGSDQGLKLWQELMHLTGELQGVHRANQTLLEGLMRHNQQALDLLVRLANPDQVYQADGSTTGSFGPRSRGQV